MARILVIDDEDVARGFISRCLARQGHEVIETADGNQGLAKFREVGADLIITDIVMPEKEGIATIVELRGDNFDGPILAVSGACNSGRGGDYLKVAQKLGADAVLAKPFSSAKLMEHVTALLARKAR